MSGFDIFDEPLVGQAKCLGETYQGFVQLHCVLDKGHAGEEHFAELDGQPITWTDATAQGRDPILDHPVVKQLQQALLDAGSAIGKVEAKRDAAIQKVTEVRSKRQAFIDSYAAQLAEFDAEIREAQDAAYQARQKLYEAENAKDNALKAVENAILAQQADQALGVARERWQAIIKASNWLWADTAWDYQMLCIEFVASAIDRDLGGVAILDQMGLGKTLEARGALDLLQAHDGYLDMLRERMNSSFNFDGPESTATLWVCPSSIKISTRKELAKWSDKPAVALDGSPEVRAHIVRMAHANGMTLIVGYEQMRDRMGKPVTPELLEVDWPIIVMDEIHKAKNRDSATFHNMKKLVEKSAFCIPMTGTPIMNRADEFWTILHFITQNGRRKGEFDKFGSFEATYLSAYYGQSNMFAPGAFDLLIDTVKDMVIRRRKDEVKKDMPDKIRSVRFVELYGEQLDIYNEMRDKLYIWLDEQKSDSISASNFLAQLTRLRQIALLPSGVKVTRTDPETGVEYEAQLDCNVSAKVDEAMTVIEELMDANEKVLLFSNYNAALIEVQKRLAEKEYTWQNKDNVEGAVRSGAIIGGVKPEERASLQDRFNDPEDDLRVLVGNIKAMGVGLNLQGACSNAIFLDLDWTPGGNEQAEDRLHRGGQTENVTIHIIQAEHTVDEFIAAKLEGKQGLIDGLIERDELRRALDDGMI